MRVKGIRDLRNTEALEKFHNNLAKMRDNKFKRLNTNLHKEKRAKKQETKVSYQ